MKNENPYIDALIQSYVAGTLDKEAFDQLKSWTMTSEEHRRYVRKQLEIWFSSGVVLDTTLFNKEQAYQHFRKHRRSGRHGKMNSPYLPWKRSWKIAAAILLLLLPFAGGYWRGKESLKHTFTDIILEAPLGSRTKTILPDGTAVWLNSGSKMKYSQGFGMNERRVTMEGEGYFEVAHNEKIPFIIHTHEVDLQVLGTKFNFCNYPDEQEAEVCLMEGKVRLQNQIKTMEPLYLLPDEKMILNKRTGAMTKCSISTHNANTWINNELFFDEELLEDIAHKLSRNFNTQIEVADSLKEKRFFGSFSIAGNNIESVLTTLTATNRVHYRKENGKFILY